MIANILIVESNNSDFNSIKSVLKLTSANLFRAKSYNKTLKLFSEQYFEIIIINVEVDNQAGLDIIREIRKMPRGQEVKIILFAKSFPDEKQIVEAVNIGVVDFISKPLNKQILLGKTNTYLDLIVSQKLLIENEKREKVSAQTIINNSPVIAFRWRNDENQSMEYVSENITRISGYSMNDFLSGQYKIIDVVHPDDLSRVMEEVVTFSNEREKTSFTHKPFRIIRKDKSVIWVDERLIIIRNEDGKVIKFQGMLIDITEQIEAEKASEIERSKARKYLELVDVMMIAVDKKGLITMVNPKTCEVLKYEKSELLGKDWILKILYKEDGEDILDIDKFLADDFPDYFENYILTKSGEKRLIVWHKTSLKDEKGKIYGVLCSGQDVTSQRQSELENMKLTTAIEHSNSSIVITDINGNIEYVNPYFTEITGYSLEEVVGQNPRILKSSEIKSEEYKNLWKTISSGENWKGEFHNLKKSGESYWESAVIAPVKDNSGKIISYIAVKQDITDKIKAHKDLIDAKEKAEESDRLKSAFLANMSHEIRTPMNAILGFSQLLNTPELSDDDKQSYLSIINNTGNQLLIIIDDIINISRIEAGIIELVELEFDLNRIIEDTYETIKVNAEMEKVDLSYSVDLKDEKTIIFGDKGKLSQILINLINNAVKFTKSGGSVKFGYSINKNMLLFYVKDTGIGIETKDQKIIFERFRQVEHKGKVYGGTGIGLSIVNAFINKMGGKIWLESQVGEGTTFYFEIPYNPVSIEGVDSEEADYKFYQQKLSGKTILIAEDEDLNFLLMAEFFKDAKVNILHAENGKEAVEMFKSNEGISLVIMDLKMPVMSGYDATIAIKKIRPKIPVIAQTAYAMSTDRAKALAAGCDDYIAKPIVFEEFIKLISKYI